MKLILKRRIHWCNQEMQQYLNSWTRQIVLETSQEDC